MGRGGFHLPPVLGPLCYPLYNLGIHLECPCGVILSMMETAIINKRRMSEHKDNGRWMMEGKVKGEVRGDNGKR